jgi:large subunit ribosomal protein L7/L12
MTLNIIEINQLTKLFQQRCGISDAELTPMGNFVPGAGGGGAAAEPAEAVEEKTIFDLKLNGFDAASKIKVIKEVRTITGLGLKEAKEMVEGAPKVIKKGIKKEEAEELMEKLKAIGGDAEMV